MRKSNDERLLINADDFGYSEAVNTGIAYCFDNNLIDRTTIMVNMPALDEAKDIAEKRGFLNRVGLHLNIVEGTPLTYHIRKTQLCNPDGTFNNNAFRITKNRLLLNRDIQRVLGEEIEAQVELFFSKGFTLKHLDSHQHSHNNLSVLEILVPILRKRFTSIRLCRDIPFEEIAGIKKAYKKVINKKILKLNSDTRIMHFGSCHDVEVYLQRDSVEGVELETHPAISDGKLIDMYNEENIEDWISRVLRDKIIIKG